MYLSTSVHLTKNNKDNIDLNVLKHLAYHSARLYNVGLYNVRQHFFNTGQYLSYNDNYAQSNQNENYALLTTDLSQQTLRLVDHDMKAFFKLLKAKNMGKYSFPVRLPRYKNKEGMMPFAVQGRSCRIQKDGKVAIGLTEEFRTLYGIPYKRFFLTIPKNLSYVKQFKEMRFKPMHNGNEFKVEFVYESTDVRNYELVSENANGYLSIDIGVDNLMACSLFSNGESHQFIIDGRHIKAINHRYNKEKARLQGEYSKNKSINGMDTKRFRRISNARLNKIDDYFNKAVSYLMKVCKAYDVGTVVIGYNKGQKQEINNGKKNNQNFVCIPFHRLRSKLMYKCELCGITYVPQEESYTSQASCLDMDFIPTYGEEGTKDVTFSGKRTKRGLYRSSDGSLLNADINGSVNILRKYLDNKRKGNALSADSVRALVNVPVERIITFPEVPSFRWG